MLTHLGALTVVMVFACRLPAALAGLGLVASWLLAPVWVGDPTSSELIGFLATGAPYRLTTFIVFGLAGVLTARLIVTDLGTHLVRGRAWGLGLGALLLAMVLLAWSNWVASRWCPTRAPIWRVWCRLRWPSVCWVSDRLWPPRCPRPVGHLVAAMGGMSLTIYVLQDLWLAAYVGPLEWLVAQAARRTAIPASDRR